MRKYQQLLLLVISAISVIVLFSYKSENNRLKYILHVVNFFGRKDAALMMRLENATKDDDFNDFAYPLPVWQKIGDSFHAYSSFWQRNELMAGGEAVALVTGKKSAIINFKCALQYSNDRIITGKFKFYHLDESEAPTDKIDFFSYKFLCKLSRDFGVPEKIIFTEVASKVSYKLLLRHVKPQVAHGMQIATICLNMADFNKTMSFATKANLLQFFFYHQTIGIDHFFIYNGDAVPYHIRKVLRKTSVNLNYFPFNFPFAQNDPKKIRKLIETDCLMRNTNGAKFTFLLNINEFVYPNRKIQDTGSVLRSLDHYDRDIKRFELASFGVCLDHKNKLLIDNTLYDPELKFSHKLYAYKPTMQTESNKSVTLPLSLALTHRYVDCFSTKDGFYDWRNSLRQDFMQYIESVRTEIGFLF
ncbi:uncharacterized protein LOC129906843 [Episyrphus balteatus]|uniref:uncharacterized protein LOC129906843 n=1 Tax=Episyrphus balteatus TaxID=286459 RepID=UPI0024863E14|nr:uncharacterized protein LOC129906843 [Episyrphus balteatus]